MLPGTNVVPSGMLSLTFTSFGAVPSALFSVIVYVISSPNFTLSPDGGFAVLLITTCGLFTIVSTVFVSFPSTVAVFSIVYV